MSRICGSVLGATLIISGLFLVIWGIRENLRWKTLPLRIPTLGNHSIDAVKPTSLLVFRKKAALMKTGICDIVCVFSVCVLRMESIVSNLLL